MIKKYLLVLLLTSPMLMFGQKLILMEEINGVYYIPCKVNGIPLKFVFDTGATNVTISKTEALFLFKQGLLTKKDVIKNTEYQIANGDIEEGMEINIMQIEIEDIVLNNISATVINNNSAPLLLGQSALKQLGKISINGKTLTIENYDKNQTITSFSDYRKQTIKYYNDILSNYYDKEDLKVIVRMENENLNFILFGKENVDDSNWSDKKDLSKETIEKQKSFAYFLISKFICNTEEKSQLFKLNDFKKIIFSFQSMTKLNGYNFNVSMKMSDYNNLLKPYTELEFVRILE